jgi:hypothetical protein
MGDLVYIDTVRQRRDDSLQSLWDSYRAAQDRAQKSGDIADGIAAGKAWAAWLDAFRAVSA